MRERPHEKLVIYRKAHELAVQVHKLRLALPSFERFEEGSQLRRSAESVSAQIVEGHALRSYKAEYVHYLWRAYASAEEVTEHVRFILETHGTGGNPQVDELLEAYGQLASNIFRYIQSVEQGHDPEFHVREEGEKY